MNPRQRRFAEEYAVDHNGAQAAIRAGYAPGRAKQTARDLLKRPDVTTLIAELDEKARVELGVSKEWLVAQAVAGWEKAFAGAPKVTRDGEPITVDDERIMEWNPTGAVKFLELLAKVTGALVDRTQVDVTGEVVYTLTLDRELDEADDDDEA